ncbi:hypothetical protein CP10139811_0060 [Chlamydia ibidis]|uniref:Uncharacterized protein n=1 Tax=Chlamydia ibidis TaxID=1405396 RepID=S7J5Y0_9CHLA|nr:hypothetical protein CP10139811_0060 [Chlamydia ibidis]
MNLTIFILYINLEETLETNSVRSEPLLVFRMERHFIGAMYAEYAKFST